MTHLTSDEFVDALDNALDPARQVHLDACEPCQQQLTELAGVLGDARSVAVPAPSPLYWEHLSQRVRTAIDAEPAPSGGWRELLNWRVLAPIAALAALIVVLAGTVPMNDPVDPGIIVAGESGDVARDDSWVAVTDLVGDLDWDTAVSAGLTVEPGDADQAVLALTASEQQELLRLLKAELARAKS